MNLLGIAIEYILGVFLFINGNPKDRKERMKVMLVQAYDDRTPKNELQHVYQKLKEHIQIDNWFFMNLCNYVRAHPYPFLYWLTLKLGLQSSEPFPWRREEYCEDVHRKLHIQTTDPEQRAQIIRKLVPKLIDNLEYIFPVIITVNVRLFFHCTLLYLTFLA